MAARHQHSRYKNATTVQKERQSKFPNISVNTAAAVGVSRGKWVTLVQSMCMMLCSMSASTRWHRPLATLEYIRNPQEINCGVKAAVKPHGILSPPLKDSYWIWFDRVMYSKRHIFLHSVWESCSLSLIPETYLNPITSAVYVWTLRITIVS